MNRTLHRSFQRSFHKFASMLMLASLLASLLAGVIPPAAIRTVLPQPVATLAETLLPAASTAQAAANQTPLQNVAATSLALTGQPTPVVFGSGSLTVTKSVVNSSQSNFEITLTGPSYPSGAQMPIISGTQVITGLAGGIYTITEVSPGTGWTTAYTLSTAANFASGYSTSNSAVITLTNPITAAAVAPGQITGRAFVDYNEDGMISANGTITDTGAQSVTVTVYDRNGTVAGTTTTNASGLYTLTPTLAGPWRIEFTNLPAGYEPSRVYTGTQNGTSSQFVNSVPATNVNLAVLEPCDYCQSDPLLVIPIYRNGDPLGGGTSASQINSYAIRYSASGTAPAVTNISQHAQTGALWGQAYQGASKQLFRSAVIRRHDGLGSGGLGAIYRTDMSAALPNASLFVDLETLGVDFGSIASNTARGLTAASSGVSTDTQAFPLVGKAGIGGIDLSADGKTLYVVNLFDRKLYQATIGSPAVAPTALSEVGTTPWLASNPCLNGQARPWAVKQYRDKIYAGIVCSSENEANAGTVLNSFASLKAHVYVYNPATTSWSQTLTVPLNYTKGQTSSARHGSLDQYWLAWTDVFTRDTDSTATVSAGASFLIDTGRVSRPMPILADLAFDSAGNLILGFIDRGGMMMGWSNRTPDYTSGTELIQYNISGDILRACGNATSGWTLEQAGVCGGVTGGGANSQGPANGEFYAGDFFSVSGGVTHNEAMNGALATLPGTNDVASAAMDPFAIDSGGVYWLSNLNGSKSRAAQLYAESGTFSGSTSVTNGSFGKSGAMGDIAVLCDPAPIEIGNRVWHDVDNDGVQDAGEPALSGVVVTLQTPQGSIQTTTDVNGRYIFTREANTGAYSTTLRTNTPYTITIDPNQVALSGYSLTVANSQAISGSSTSNDAILDTRDSDAVLVSNLATIYYATGSAGQNNHGLDVGFAKTPPPAALAITNTYYPLSLGNRVWFDTNDNGIVDSTEVGVNNVAVELYLDTDGTTGFSAGDPVISTTTTANGGYYTFSNLLEGNYLVVITSTNFVNGGPLYQYQNSTASVAGNSDLNNQDHGNLVGALGSGGLVASSPISLTHFTEPINDGDSDNNSNLSIDFGFYKISIGNRLWAETIDNGIRQFSDGDEPGVNGVTLYLYDLNDMLVATTVTAGTNGEEGGYAFDGLISGTYYITFVIPSGYRSATDRTTSGDPNNNVNGDDNVVGTGTGTARTANFTLSAGDKGAQENNTVTDSNGSTFNKTIDFAIYKPQPKISVTKFTNDFDADNNTGPLVKTGVPVTWTYSFTNTGQVTLTNVTASDDQEDLSAATCTPSLPVATLAVGASITCRLTGTALQGIYSNTVTVTGTNTLNPSEQVTSSNPSHYSGYMAGLGNYVWIDSNQDGMQGDPAIEPGVAGVTVTLYENSLPIQTTTTDADGYYQFIDLTTGTPYSVSFEIPAGYLFTTANDTVTASDTSDSDAVPNSSTTGASDVIMLSPDEFNQTLDAGLILPLIPMSLGNRIWYDTNNDGLDNDGNGSLGSGTGVSGVAVELYQDSNGNGVYDAGDQILSTTTTSAAGYYTFSNLLPTHYPTETYLVKLPASNFTSGGPLTGYHNSDPTVAGDSDLNQVDHGYLLNGALGDTGVIASGPITLSQYAEPINDGDSDSNSNLSIDFGFYTLSVGNKIWQETVDNGLRLFSDGDEPGLNGVEVRLYQITAPNDLTGTLAATTTTRTIAGQPGEYLFSGLMSGTYRVEVVAPAFMRSASDAPSTGNSDNNINGDDDGIGSGYGLISSPSFTLIPADFGAQLNNAINTALGSSYNKTIDFGLYQLKPSIDLKKYTNDVDADSPSGPTLAYGNEVTWRYVVTNTGEVTLTHLSLVDDPEGSISCPKSELAIGETMICLQAGTAQLGQYANSAIVTGTPIISAVVGIDPFPNVTASSSVTDSDPSHYVGVPLSLGNRVWHDVGNGNPLDANYNNGQLDAGESGIAGVVLQLLNGSGNPVMEALTSQPYTTTSDSQGYYTFTNLAVGDYKVRIVASNFDPGGALVGYTSSNDPISAASPNDNDDSDDNGIGVATAGNIDSAVVTLAWNDEPTGEEHLGGSDSSNLSNYTLDFGFYTLPLPASMQVVKTLLEPSSGIAKLGDRVSYALQIENTGAVSLTEVTVNDIYSAQYLSFIDSSIDNLPLAPTAQSVGGASGILTWTLSSSPMPIAPGGVITITVNFTATKP